MIMVESVPVQWPVYHMGYHHMVCTHQLAQTHGWGKLWRWLYETLGGISNGAWIDQGSYICFVHESDALLFEMVWS